GADDCPEAESEDVGSAVEEGPRRLHRASTLSPSRSPDHAGEPSSPTTMLRGVPGVSTERSFASGCFAAMTTAQPDGFTSLLRIVLEQPQRRFGDEVVARLGRVRAVPEQVAVGVPAHRVHDHAEAETRVRHVDHTGVALRGDDVIEDGLDVATNEL